jgi:hypothetical protein
MSHQLHPQVEKFLGRVARRKLLPKNPHPEVLKYFSKLGKKTKGKKVPSRRHTEPGYYSRIAKLRWDKQKKKNESPIA